MTKRDLTKQMAKKITGVLTSELQSNANSTACILMYQPKIPKKLEQFKKNYND